MERRVGAGGPAQPLLDLSRQLGDGLQHFGQLRRLRQQEGQRLAQLQDEAGARRLDAGVVQPTVRRQLLLQHCRHALHPPQSFRVSYQRILIKVAGSNNSEKVYFVLRNSNNCLILVSLYLYFSFLEKF